MYTKCNALYNLFKSYFQIETQINLKPRLMTLGVFMKNVFALSLLVGLTASADIGQKDLEFCRTVNTGGMFGQPKGESQHCVLLRADGRMTDNANTFFGNPPKTEAYTIAEIKVDIIIDDEVIGATTTYWVKTTKQNGKAYYAYQITNQGTKLENSVGAVLTLQADK